jgi:pimeloyl-ACP methyl ester carboxylesterase
VSRAARLRRAYFDCRYGQLHVHQTIPPGGGFDEAAPLLCIPGRQGTARFFQPLLAAMGADRSIYAPDLPGCGESDGAGAGAGPEQYALALIDLLDSLRQRQIDVLAQAEGAETAIAMERLRPHALLRRVVLSGASSKAVEAVRDLKIKFRELALAGLSPEDRTEALKDSQLTELIEFLGAASHA